MENDSESKSGKQKRLDLELRTIAKRQNYTIGKLFIGGEYFCDTLEDRCRDLKDLNNDGDFDDEGEGKIKGKTAISAGRYEIILTYSPKFKRILPLLVGVPGFDGIRIHFGNDENDTEGCILVGENKVVGKLINSRFWSNLLNDKLDSYKRDGYRIFITVKR